MVQADEGRKPKAIHYRKAGRGSRITERRITRKSGSIRMKEYEDVPKPRLLCPFEVYA